MSDAKTFIRNNVSVLVTHILIYLQGLVLTPILIKTAGVTLYGGYVLLISMIGFIFGISSFGVGFRYRRFMPGTNDKQKRKTLFFTQFTFQLSSVLLVALLFIVFFSYIDKLFFNGGVNFSLWLVLPYLLFHVFFNQGANYFRFTHRISIFNYATLTKPYLFISIALFGYGISKKFTVDSLLVANTVSAFIVAVVLFRIIFKEIGLSFKLQSLKELAQDIKLGFPLVLNYVVDIILSAGDRYVIAAFLSITAVGYYSPAYALGSLVIFFAKVSGVVLPPLMSRLVDQGDEKTASKMLDYTLKGYLLLATPFVAGCALLAKPILAVYTNMELAENAFPVMPIVALGSLFYGINIILSNVLFVRMETGVMFKANAIAATLNLFLNLVVLYYFRNIMLAAIITVISYFAAFVYIFQKVRLTWILNIQSSIILKSIISSVMMAASLIWYLQIFLETPRIGVIVGAIILGIIVYMFSLVLLKTFSRHEWHLIRKAMTT